MSDEMINLILSKLDRLEIKIDGISNNGCSKAGQHVDQEGRIRDLEADRNRAVGVIALVSLFAGAIGAGILRILTTSGITSK